MTTQPRPPVVTMACLFIGLASLILFGNVVAALSDWGSTEMQDSVRKALAEPALDGYGITVEQALNWLRIILFVVVVLSIAGVVFAVYAARGHRPSRLYLTVMAGFTAVAFAVTGGVIGLVPAAFAIYVTVRLWSPEARAWFDAKDGRAVAAPAPAASVAPDAATGAARPSPVTTAAGAPPPSPPRPVRIAGAVAIVASSMVALFCAYFVLIYITVREEYIKSLSEQPVRDVLDRSGIEPTQVAQWGFYTSIVLGLIAVAGIVAAIAVLTGKSYGRRAVIVLAAITVPVALVFTVVGVPWLAAAIVVIVLLRKPESRDWFAGM